MNFLVFYIILNVLQVIFSLNLPSSHLPYYFFSYPQKALECNEEKNCPYKELSKEPFQKCWGYEYNCSWNNQFNIPSCPEDHKGWVKTKFDQINTFFTQADFGYIKQQLKELKVLCEPLFPDDSSLECSEHLRFCRGRNILVNFTSLKNRLEPIRYKMDVLGPGDIGGYCKLKKQELEEQTDHLSPLQSWAPEMRFFEERSRRPIQEGDCEVVVDKPTFLMKIDATVNMYHHFCDFLNLYASLHLNSSHWQAFSTNVNILIWESHKYRSLFQETWQAFTDYPLLDLNTFRGKTVCFKNVVFPLLPRMIFGLYYNTPIIYGCQGSGLFSAFSEFILHRLRVPLIARTSRKVRVTLLSRNTTFRRILNEEQLFDALLNVDDYEVQKVVYDKNVPFKKQLEITRNSDVLLGMHGAGLTHSLFLPDWASVFEIYNCEDVHCYYDLVRLRGLYYITWENHDKFSIVEQGNHTGGAHAKFVNYQFEVEEFLRLVDKAADHVRRHSKFKAFLQQNFHDEL